MEITVDASELRALAADIGDAGTKVGREGAQIVNKSAQAVLRGAQERSRVGATGDLKGGWHVSGSGDGRSAGMSRSVDNNVRYAKFHEYGTSKMSAQPMSGPALDAEEPNFVSEWEKLMDSILD